MNILEEPDENTLIIELIHVDTSFVNALRRIMLSEVPTVALEHIYMWNNSSIIHDEVLAHRLGLIPINLDARYLDDIIDPSTNNQANDTNEEQFYIDNEGDDHNPNDAFVPTDRNTVVFRLAVSCTKPTSSSSTSTTSHVNRSRTSSIELDMNTNNNDNDNDETVVQPDAEIEAAAIEASILSSTTVNTTNCKVYPSVAYAYDRPYTKHVYSSDLIWVPQGDQEETLPQNVKPIHDDILIAKLRPGQAIELEAHARKGIGKDHAKFSPVATASYRLMPKITIIQPIYDEIAEELVHVYEPGVFDLIPTEPNIDPPNTKIKARLINPYACTMSRNYMRHPILDQSIRMTRISDHFIFSIESVGMYRPGILLAEALRILQKKCHHVIDMVNDVVQVNQVK
jgi:DNA-directed RNA polymerases I and III subunit RPAC1